MKKSEQRIEIRKKAPEYAKSGEFNSWLSIEHRLLSEGYSEAHLVLDDHITREQLNSLCKIAQSTEETERRTNFKSWLKVVVQEVAPQLQADNIRVSVSLDGNSLAVSNSECSIEIRRLFNTMQLENSKAVNSKSGTRYRFGFERISADITYNFISMEDLKALILKLCKSAIALSKNM